MRLLHTSDWHLGRRLHRADLREAQAAFLDALVETVRHEAVDAVLVAGDVYDRAVPPVDAVEMCESALVRLRQAGAQVVLISGNHDSARRLGFASALLADAGVHLRTRVEDCGRPVLLEDRHGQVAVHGIPYLEPAAQEGGAALGHAGVLGRGLELVRADLRDRPGVRSVVLAHAWVGRGAVSESERDLTLGGVGSVPASLFDAFTYSALGHLHGAQELAPGLRYSGSPLAYSFSEAAHVKGSWLVELDARGLSRVELVPAPVPRRLSCVRGRLDELLRSPRFTPHESDWLTVTCTDPARPDDAMALLSRRFPHVLALHHEPEGRVEDGRSYGARTAGRSDLEVGCSFVEHVRGSAADQAELDLLEAALEAGRLPTAA